MSTLPSTHSPAECLEISPEALEIANCYLQNQDIRAVADALEVPVDLVQRTLARKDIKSYINQVFFDLGFNNRFKMRKAMDALIQKKFQELEEADSGSNKDIAELLALSHKMSVELLDKEIQLLKLQQETGPKSQVNVQINDGSSRYSQLLEKLLGDKLA